MVKHGQREKRLEETLDLAQVVETQIPVVGQLNHNNNLTVCDLLAGVKARQFVVMAIDFLLKIFYILIVLIELANF